MHSQRSLLLLACLFFGCFDPDLSHSTFTCTAKEGYLCPPGQGCFDGVCRPLGYIADAAAPAPSDLAVTAAPDLARPYGCASVGGKALGSGFACPGSFNPGQASGRCAVGYVPCTSAAGLDLPACYRLEGFFLANVVGRYPVAGDISGIQCTGPDYYRVVYGCGNPLKAKQTPKGCEYFTQIVDCRDINSDFRCSTPPFDNIDNMTNPYPLDGVLCCVKP